VSGATYRIDVEHHPEPESAFQAELQWLARVTRISDESPVTHSWAQTPEEAVEKARAWLYAQNVKQSGHTVYVDDEGAEVKP
jgi:hypothetical protein